MLTANVKLNPYNATGNGIADDRAAVQSAIDAVAAAGGGCVYFPKGIYLIGAEPGGGAIGGLQMKSNVLLQGEAPRAAVLKLANGTNRTLLYGPSNVNSLWGTGSTAGLQNWSALNIELDGNRANNSSGNGVWIYGLKPVVQNLFIGNIAENAWRTEYGDDAPLFSMEGSISNVYIDTCGKHGFWFSGPHDSVVTNLIVIDASQTTHNIYDSMRIEGVVASRFVNCHTWNRGTVTNRARYGLADLAGASDYLGCQFEGAFSANVYVEGPVTTFDACNFFAAANGINVLLRATQIVIRARLLAPLSGAPACKGIVLGQSGDWVAANDIDVYVAEQGAGAVDFTNSSGENSVRVRGFLPSGVPYVGTPQLSDDVDFYCSGAAGAAFKQFPGDERSTAGFTMLSETDGISAAGTTQGTATQLPDTSASHVTTVAANTGVRLPSNSTPGKLVYVHNSGANTLKIYPATGQQINNLAANAALSVTANKGVTFIYDASRWMASLSA